MTQTAEVPAETTVNVADLFDKDDNFGPLFFERISTSIAALNSKTTDLKSLSSDPAEVTEAVKASDDAKAVKYRADLEALNAKVASLTEAFNAWAAEQAKARISESADTAKVAALTEERTALQATVKAQIKSLAAEYGDKVTAALPAILSLKGGGGGSSQTGIRRPRGFDVTVDGVLSTAPNNKGEQVSSFSAAAKVLGVSTSDVFAGYTASEGEDAEKWEAGKTVAYSVKGKDGNDHAVTATKRTTEE